MLGNSYITNEKQCLLPCSIDNLPIWITFLVFTRKSWAPLHFYVDSWLLSSFDIINFDSKGSRDVVLTCRCHMSNIMPDSISNDWMVQGISFIEGFHWRVPFYDVPFSLKWFNQGCCKSFQFNLQDRMLRLDVIHPVTKNATFIYVLCNTLFEGLVSPICPFLE